MLALAKTRDCGIWLRSLSVKQGRKCQNLKGRSGRDLGKENEEELSWTVRLHDHHALGGQSKIIRASTCGISGCVCIAIMCTVFLMLFKNFRHRCMRLCIYRVALQVVVVVEEDSLAFSDPGCRDDRRTQLLKGLPT